MLTVNPRSKESLVVAFFLISGLLLAAAAAPAQLLPEQRRADFEQLAALVSRAYAPYEWKRERFGNDALRIAPWLERVRAAQSDLEYFEICAEYLAGLRDLHTGFTLPSDFVAEIPLGADLYDGRALIDTINRAELPADRYPFEVGDEVVSVDGESAAAWIDRTARLQSFADDRATRRWALDQLFFRAQAALPSAPRIGASARVVVKRRATGALESYDIPWLISGTPFTVSGPIPFPQANATLMEAAPDPSDSWRRSVEAFADRSPPRFKRLRRFGSVFPAFEPPDGFRPRQGQVAGSLVFSGAYPAGGYTIGLLRIPAFPTSQFAQATMLRIIDTELAFFRDNVDGLVVDVTRNPGGSVCLTNEILRRFIPVPFRTVADEFRPTWEIVQLFRQDVEDAKFLNASPATIAVLEGFLKDVETAYYEFRGRTGPIPACGLSLDLTPLPGYAGPMLVLIDEFSASSADAFPAVLQDNNRALMFGRTTAGGGGLSVSRPIGPYGEASAALSVTLGIRPRTTQIPGLPSTNTLENNGAWPDIEADIMTEENLLSGGRPFVEAFTRAMIEHIERSRAPLTEAAPGRATRAVRSMPGGPSAKAPER